MREIPLSSECIASIRFAVSPMAEVAGSLQLLVASELHGQNERHRTHRPWLEQVQRRLAGTDLRLLRGLQPVGGPAPEFLYRGADRNATAADQLAGIGSLSADLLLADVYRAWEGRGEPSVTVRATLEAGPAGVDRLIAQLRDYWIQALRPWWPRICAIVDDELALRAADVVSEGLGGLLARLHPDLSWNGHTLCAAHQRPRPGDAGPDLLTLVPSAFSASRVVLSQQDDDITLTYGARGVGRLWEKRATTSQADRLGALVGRTRAWVLQSLSVPCSTTELATDIGYSPATISQHLAVLLDTGLVESWACGRRVLYRHTPLGASVAASAPGAGRRRRTCTNA